MKILITTFTYTPNKDGVAEACRVMAEGLVSRNWDVSVATSMGAGSPNDFETFQAIQGVKVYYFSFNKKISNSSFVSEKYIEFLKNKDFDLIINQCWDAQITLATLDQVRCLKAKLVQVSHGYGGLQYFWHPCITMGIGSWLRNLLFTLHKMPKLIRAYDQIIFLSHRRDFGRFFDHWMAKVLNHPNIQIVANGVHNEKFKINNTSFRENYGINESLIALCIANYSDRKNQLLTIKSFREANVPGTVLLCIGSEFNDYSKKVFELDQKLSRIYSDCRVILLDKMSREETLSALMSCDIFLLTAKAETQPIVIIEAMAATKPWISTNTGCVMEMKGGMIAHSKKQLVTKIRKLFNDAELRKKLGNEGYKEVNLHYDAGKNVSKYDGLFKELISQNP